jgi:hypothetical protein
MVQFLKENASSGLTSVRDATALVKENLRGGRVKQQGWVSEALPIISVFIARHLASLLYYSTQARLRSNLPDKTLQLKLYETMNTANPPHC